MERENSIEVEGLVREFKKGRARSTGSTCASSRRDLRLPRAERRRQVDDRPDADDAAAADAGTARVGGYDVVKEGPKVRASIGAALQEAALDPLLTGRDHLRLQRRCRASRQTAAARDELLDRVGLSEAADRKVAATPAG
jgi:ABC-2 type transport system ATP-binding protein